MALPSATSFLYPVVPSKENNCISTPNSFINRSASFSYTIDSISTRHQAQIVRFASFHSIPFPFAPHAPRRSSPFRCIPFAPSLSLPVQLVRVVHHQALAGCATWKSASLTGTTRLTAQPLMRPYQVVKPCPPPFHHPSPHLSLPPPFFSFSLSPLPSFVGEKQKNKAKLKGLCQSGQGYATPG